MVEVSFPRLLDPATGGQRRIQVDAGTIAEAIDAVVAQLPGVEVHLFDHAGALRPHVLCVVDGEATRLNDREQRGAAEIRFVQAVSGG